MIEFMVDNIKKLISRRTLITILVIAVLYGAVKTVELTGLANDYWLRVLDQSLITVIGALGLSVIYGFTGQFSLGHAAFYGIGAYTAGVIGNVWGHGDMMYFMLALFAGALVAGVAALLVGMPILRLRSDYLGIAMLGFGVIVKVIMDNSNKIYTPLGTRFPFLSAPDQFTLYAPGFLTSSISLTTSLPSKL